MQSLQSRITYLTFLAHKIQNDKMLWPFWSRSHIKYVNISVALQEMALREDNSESNMKYLHTKVKNKYCPLCKMLVDFFFYIFLIFFFYIPLKGFGKGAIVNNGQWGE